MHTTQAVAKGEFSTPMVKGHPMGTYSSEADYDKIDLIESPGMPARSASKRVLTTCGLVAITYLIATGGPIGSEPVIAAGGPLIGISVFVLYPLLYAAPYAYIVAELCSIFPEDGGFAVWVLHAFGPFWGFQVGFWSWVSSLFNSALLPGLILDLMTYSLDWTPSHTRAYLFKTAVAVFFAGITLLGTKCVSRISIAMMLAVFIPFAIFTAWAYATATEFDDLFEIRHESMVYNEETLDVVMSGPIDIEWNRLLSMLFLNYSNVNIASVFGGEVSNPARAYPRAIAITIILATLSCLVPIPAAICANDVHWSLLDTDSYVYMGWHVGGVFLQALMMAASFCAFGGQYMAQLYAQSFMISGMAENELIPLRLGVRNSSFGSPHVAILGTVAISLTMLSLDQSELIQLANIFSVAVQLLVVATAILLRTKLPFVSRPTKVPGGMALLHAIGVVPVVMFVYMAVMAIHNGTTAIVSIVTLIVGSCYGYFQHRRHRLSL